MKYQVTGTVTVTCFMTVEADSEEEAMELAEEGWDEFQCDKDGEPTWTKVTEMGGRK